MLKQSIILCGFMSSGKTTVGRALAKKLGVSYVDTDELIVKRSQMAISEMFEIYGEEYFRDLEHRVALEAGSMPPCVISTGGGMLTFDRNGEALKESGIIICLIRDFENIYGEISNDSSRPLAYKKTKDELKRVLDLRMDKYKEYAHYIVENNEEPEDCVEKIISIIDENQK